MNNRRLETLRAMGVDVWVRRQGQTPVSCPDTESADVESELLIETSAEVTPDPAIGVKKQPTADVSDYDWQQLESCVANCTACELHAGRTRTVFGTGNKQASWLLVGEAPGADEDQQGEPFVGRAGQLLNAMLEAIGLQREAVYIANIVKCRPPGNRNPHREEATACHAYLERQIALIQPDLILALGKVAASNLLHCDDTVGKMRGQQHRYGEAQIPLVVTYHPAYLLRTPTDKSKVWQDLLFARSVENKS